MLQSQKSNRGMVVAPHHLAAQAGLQVLRDGGNAIEATVAAAAARAWHAHAGHRAAQAKGKAEIFRRFRIRVAEVLRDYD